jgi:putative acetyltransferase
MKRLFVRPGFRGRGLGKRLVERILAEARAIDYRMIRLDTLPSMQAAIQLYEALGFARGTPYSETPVQDTVCMELKL